MRSDSRFILADDLISGGEADDPSRLRCEWQDVFHLRFIGRRRRDAGELHHAIAGIKHDGNFFQASLLADGIEQCRSGGAIAVIGNDERIGGAAVLAGGEDKFATQVGVRAFCGFAVEADDLLPRGVGEAG